MTNMQEELQKHTTAVQGGDFFSNEASWILYFLFEAEHGSKCHPNQFVSLFFYHSLFSFGQL